MAANDLVTACPDPSPPAASDDDLEFLLEAAFLEEERREVAAAAAAPRVYEGNSCYPRRGDGEPGPSTRPPAGPAGGPGASALAQLGDPLMLRVLCFLSPEDLLALAQTSRLFRAWGADPLLWRRAYRYRWPEGARPGEDDTLTWKEQYLERDRADLAAVMHDAPAALQPVYLQAARAKRSEAAGPPPGRDAFNGEDRRAPALLRWHVDAWRRERGLTDAAGHAAHACAAGSCEFVRLEGRQSDAWLCDATGFLHLCGDNCAERELDRSGDLLICPITGRCFERLLTPAEEAGGDRERGQGRAEEGDRGEDWNEEEGMGGRLGRAYYAGYNCADEAELATKFGIRFR